MIHQFHSQTLSPETIASLPMSMPDFRSEVDQIYPPVSQHDDSSPDILLAGRVSKEIARVSGAMVEVFSRTDNNNIDHVWGEDPDPTYWQPIKIKGIYTLPAIAVNSELWGPDTIVTFKIWFSYQEILELFGARMIRHGDVMRVPINSVMPVRIQDFEVTSSTPTQLYRYHWMWWECTLINITGDVKAQPEPNSIKILGDYV